MSFISGKVTEEVCVSRTRFLFSGIDLFRIISLGVPSVPLRWVGLLRVESSSELVVRVLIRNKMLGLPAERSALADGGILIVYQGCNTTMAGQQLGRDIDGEVNPRKRRLSLPVACSGTVILYPAVMTMLVSQKKRNQVKDEGISQGQVASCLETMTRISVLFSFSFPIAASLEQCVARPHPTRLE